MLNYPHDAACAAQVCWLPLDKITPRMTQPFGREDSPSMAEMCESIRRDGLQQPITVRRMSNGGFMIVSGNRRYLACRMLGMSHIDAVVLPGTAEDQSLRETLDMLLSRRMHYLDEAKAMASILDSGAMDRDSLARSLGITPATLRDKLRLLELDEKLRILLVEQGLSERIACTLLRLPDQQARMSIALKAAREHLGVRDVGLLVTAAQERLPVPPPPGGKTITLMRDHRLYLNAIRAIAAQMEEAGIPAQMTERTLPDAVEITLRLPTRRRRRRHASSGYSTFQ
ncbi:MAG: ParB/RepB/Spo0J family partition protein [Aristaeellaceae bacterium]